MRYLNLKRNQRGMGKVVTNAILRDEWLCETPVGADQEWQSKYGEWHRWELRWFPVDLSASREGAWRHEKVVKWTVQWRKFWAVSLLYVSNKIRFLSLGGQHTASSFYGIDENSFKLMKWDTEEVQETPCTNLEGTGKLKLDKWDYRSG